MKRDKAVKIIRKNYIYENMIKKLVLYEKDIDERYKLLRFLAYYDTRVITGKYSDYFIENETAKIGEEKIKNVRLNECVRGTVLHIHTSCSKTGGHTNVITNWIQNDKKHISSLCLIDQRNHVDVPERLKKAVEKSGGRITFLSARNDLKKAIQLIFIASMYEKIILHINVEDLVPVLAFSNPKWDRSVILFNHADFRPWIGISIADYVIDFYEDSNKRTKNLRKAALSSVLCLPVIVSELNKEYLEDKIYDEKKALIKRKFGIRLNNKIILSAGRQDKFTTVCGYDFIGFIDELLSENCNLVIIVVGIDFDTISENKWLKRWVKSVSKFKGRLIVKNRMEKDKLAELMDIADLYLNSFPVGGGQTVMDAAFHKLPVVGLRIKELIVDEWEDIVCNDIGELKRKITKILNMSNEEKKQYADNLYHKYADYNWSNKLEEIYAMPLEHKVHKFTPERRISDYEILQLNLGYYKKISDLLKDDNSYFTKLSIKNRVLLKIMYVWLLFTVK